jgi:GT2 family glycosyltransferase
MPDAQPPSGSVLGQAPGLRLSVVIPAKDRARELQACLEALFASRHEGFEVVVVDDGSRDETAAVAERRGCRVVRHGACRGAAAARNTGARAARGEILLFLDSDVLVDRGLLAEVDRAFESPATQAVVGLLAKDALHPNFASQYDALYMHYQYWTHAESIAIFYTSCAAIRRALFIEHGGFDENYKGAGIEDMELGQRLVQRGVSLRLDKRLQVSHAHAFTVIELLAKNRRTASGTLKIMLRNLSAGRRNRRLVAPPWSFLLGIPLTLVAAALLLAPMALPPACALPALPVAGAVLLLNRRFLGFLLRQRGAAFLVRGCAFLLVNNLAYAAGILGGAIAFAAGYRY